MLRRAWNGIYRAAFVDDPRSRWKWRATAFILVALVSSIGCNPGTLLHFLIPIDPTIPADYPLAKSGKEVKVVLLASHLQSRTRTPQLFNADRQLAKELAKVLKNRFKELGDKVTIVPAYKVEEYKAKNPDWKDKSDRRIGKEFSSDYVVSLAIANLSLYERGSRLLYRGNAEIYVRVTDVNGPEGSGPAYEQEFVTAFPKHGPEPADYGQGVGHFRVRFLRHMAQELAHLFAPFPSPSLAHTDMGF